MKWCINKVMIKLSLIFKFWKFKIKTKLFSDKKINNSFTLKASSIAFDYVKVCVLNTELWIASRSDRNIYIMFWCFKCRGFKHLINWSRLQFDNSFEKRNCSLERFFSIRNKKCLPLKNSITLFWSLPA